MSDSPCHGCPSTACSNSLTSRATSVAARFATRATSETSLPKLFARFLDVLIEFVHLVDAFLRHRERVRAPAERNFQAAGQIVRLDRVDVRQPGRERVLPPVGGVLQARR